MALFRYESVAPSGECVRGVMEAEDRTAVVAHLQQAGQWPMLAEPASAARAAAWEAGGILRRGGLAGRERAAFAYALASLLHAGLPLERSLQVLAEVSHDRAARRLADGLQQAVRSGSPFSSALQARSDVFSRFYVSMVRAAEAGGALDACLTRLAEHEERGQALRERIAGALVYPAVLLFVAAASMLAILAWVVPQFTQLFADAGRLLPLSTRIVLGAAELARDAWWVLLAAPAALALAVRAQLATRAGRERIDALLLRLPLAGGLLRRVQTARVCRALSALLAGGVPLLTALSIARDVVSNQVMAGALDVAADALRAGRSLAEPLAATGVFPDLCLQMIRVGEQTGRLEAMLARVAEVCEREVAGELARLLALLEPLLIVVLGLVIGAVVMSLLSAIVAVNDLPL